MATKPGMVGELLIRAGLIDSAGLHSAQEVRSKSHVSLGTALSSLGLTTEEAVAAAIASGLQLECLAGSTLPMVESEIIALLPLQFCQKHLVMPLSLQSNALRLAMSDPLDYSAIQDVMFRTSKQVVPVVATQTAILRLQDLFPSKTVEADETYENLTGASPEGEVIAAEDVEEAVDADKLARDTKLAPVVRLVNLMLSGAAKAGASDIHVEPKEKNLLVRQRVDGLLQEVFKIPKHLQDATISRLKIISGMDISDRRRPQDGRSRLRFEGQRIDLRVSTLPTQYGEKVVIRLLDQRRAVMPIEKIDLTPENLKMLQQLLLRPQGMILVTGPTGSGKSSTLYTALNWVKSPTTNIITVEDPIEYQLDGVNQVQINTKAGVTFASGLRSILRQDPNIILVGEIRDEETAGIALEAAQTGHLLLSTLHTNDAPATVSRLFDLGIEPFLVASALIGILAQRLVQRNCVFCSVPHPPNPETLQKFGGIERLPADAKWMAGKGCEKCMQAGFKGRLAIHELLHVNDELRALITARAPEHELRRAARAGGMRTLIEDAISKAAKGLTTLDAILQVVSPDDAAAPAEGTEATTESVLPARGIRQEPEISGAPKKNENSKPAVTDGRARILVVEDNRTIISVVKYFLELEGFDVLLAEDGLIGLKTAQREHPDVIVTDVNMPVMDGISMVKTLRADPLTRDIAILMLTSEDSLDSETSALSAGADDYILKPVEPRRLAARVKALLARSKVRQVAGVER
ncbi:MAG TPA: ATPase, T2SS/T4P/T4SS family [Candidatus Saccharimonadales bacterium]|nr:ATPase, T2SS/T4P/T4SS family [Candidatus Saccharimonadales bacterium]